MTKSLLTGIAICTALAVFTGNASAHKAHHKYHRTRTLWTNGTERGILPYGTRVNTGPHGNDPLYDACEYPWRHPDMQCPGNDTGG